MKTTRRSRNLIQGGLLILALGMFGITGILVGQTPAKAPATAAAPDASKKSPTANTSKQAGVTETKDTTASAKSDAAKAEEEKVNNRILDNIRATFSVPPNVVLKVESRGPSKVKGLDSVVVRAIDGANSQRNEILLSGDDKYAIVGRVLDLVDDPYAENMKKINLANTPVFGNKDAKITIVEYSDFECPYCSQAYHTIENDVMKQYGDKVKIVYKNFPLPIHTWAESAAVAGLCAYSQSNDAFWILYRGYFENQSAITKENVKAKSLEFAGNAKIDTKKFEECYDKKETLPQVKAEMSEAQLLGLTGTPLFIVNGRSLPGVQPFSSFQRVIDEELKKESK
jgi:protein-disulfide isomerase